MKKIRYILSIFLITFLISTAYGFPGMVQNNSNLPPDNNSQPVQIIDLANTTQSDQDIVLVMHLIELDAVSFQSENKLFVRETLIFKNLGTKNFSGNLRTWVPDGASGIAVGRTEMTQSGGSLPLPFDQKGNIISWYDFVEQNHTGLMYSVEYKVDQKTKGTLSSTETYSKMLSYPTLINYQYFPSPGFPAIVIKVTKPEGSSISFQDENGNKISPSDVTEDGNSVINKFSFPQFKEINVEISRSSVPPLGTLAVYLILGIIILLVLSYPVLRKKSEKIQAFEEKIRNSLKREEKSSEEEIVEKTGEIPAEEMGEDEELAGKTKDELLHEKNEITSKLAKLNKDYASGNLLDEEYEDLKRSYQEKIRKLDVRIDKLD